jgi:hypothetical protein
VRWLCRRVANLGGRGNGVVSGQKRGRQAKERIEAEPERGVVLEDVVQAALLAGAEFGVVVARQAGSRGLVPRKRRQPSEQRLAGPAGQVHVLEEVLLDGPRRGELAGACGVVSIPRFRVGHTYATNVPSAALLRAITWSGSMLRDWSRSLTICSSFTGNTPK